MGLGRREFLRLFGAVIASASATPASALAVCEDLYVNRRLGIAFQKPAGWVFAGFKEMKDMSEGQILADEDPSDARVAIAEANLPLLMISKEPLSTSPSRFGPGITVYCDQQSASGILPGQLLKFIGFNIDNCTTALKQFQVVSPPCATTVSECEAVSYDAKFLFEHELIQPTFVRMKTLVIAQGLKYYTLRMFDSPFVGGEDIFDYSDFVSQIKIV